MLALREYSPNKTLAYHASTLQIYIYDDFDFDEDWGCGIGEFQNSSNHYSSFYYRIQHQHTLPQILFKKLTIDFPELVTN